MTAQQFVFDPNRCTGCEACVLACWMEHRGAQTLAWRRVHSLNQARRPDRPISHLSLACHHCDHPACLENCPADAYRQDPATGAVTVLAERCIGCRYCTWACPHDAPKFQEALGTVEKCSFCQGRLEEGREPACVARCPVEALGIEPRTAQRGPLPAAIPASALGPSIRIVPGRRPAPVATAPPEPGALARHLRSLLRVPQAKITLRGEWSLVAFTSTLALLVGIMGAAAAGRAPALPWAVPGAGLAAMALSAWHLGRPGRAWRALANLRRSWLSREIALTGVFLGLASLQCLVLPGSRALAWAALAAGLGALLAVDRIYQVALRVGPGNWHSAQALFSGLYLAGILAANWPLALAAGALKAGLYLQRKWHFRRLGRAGDPALSLVRLTLGFAVPALAFGSGLGALAAVLGDLLDRCEFYDELVIPTPERTMALVDRGLEAE